MWKFFCIELNGFAVHMAQERDQCRALVSTEITFGFQRRGEISESPERLSDFKEGLRSVESVQQ